MQNLIGQKKLWCHHEWQAGTCWMKPLMVQIQVEQGRTSSFGTTLDNLLKEDIGEREFTEFKVSQVSRSFWVIGLVWFPLADVHLATLVTRFIFVEPATALLPTPMLGQDSLTPVQLKYIAENRWPAVSLMCAHPWKTMAYPKWVPDKRGEHHNFKQAPDGSWEESSRDLEMDG